MRRIVLLSISFVSLVVLLQVYCPSAAAQGGAPATGTITITGSWDQSYQYDPCQVYYADDLDDYEVCEEGYPNSPSDYPWAQDYGEIDVTVNGASSTVYYEMGDTDSTLASRLASAIQQSGAGVSASASNGTVTLTAQSDGVSTDYAFSSSSQTNDTSQFSNPSFWTSQSGPYLTGGASPGFVNPKYIVVGVTYAPPGTNSSVSYANTTSVGSTTTISSSFQSDSGFSTSLSTSIGVPSAGILPGGAGIKVTATESTDYIQGSNSSTTNTISKASTISYVTPGTPTFSPVNSDYDFIWLWVNPEVLFTYQVDPSSGQTTNLQWTGYAFDPTDPASGEPPESGPYVSGPDVVEVQVGCLDGDFSCPSTLTISGGVVTSGTLARSWADGEYDWPSGEGPGLTSADIANILTFDPLVPSNNYTELSSLPSTTSDGRFSKEPFPPNPIEYPVGGTTETYNSVQTNTQSVASGTSNSIKQAFGVSEQFGGSFLDIFNNTTTLTESQTFTWTYSYLDTLTTTTTLTDALSIKSPPDPPPSYDGPTEFTAYQDNIFGTFAFVPVNP